MTHRFIAVLSSGLRGAAAASLVGLLAACGGGTSPGSAATSGGTVASTATPDQVDPTATGTTPTSPATGTGTTTGSGTAPATGPGTTTGTGTGTGTTAGTSTTSGTSFSWTKPAGFDAMLQAEIAAQPSFMGGYGGQIANPFPQLPGTDLFPAMQITRTDAIVLDDWFGRWAFRFYVDENSRHSNGLRAEFTGEGAWDLVDGDTYNFKFAVYFDDAYVNTLWTDWNMFAQFHSPDFPAWGLHTAGGYLMMVPPNSTETDYRIAMPARDVWHDLSWTVHFAHDTTGYATLSIDGVQVFDHHGQTMHDGEPSYYPKFGSYLANNPYTNVTYETPWAVTKL